MQLIYPVRFTHWCAPVTWRIERRKASHEARSLSTNTPSQSNTRCVNQTARHRDASALSFPAPTVSDSPTPAIPISTADTSAVFDGVWAASFFASGSAEGAFAIEGCAVGGGLGRNKFNGLAASILESWRENAGVTQAPEGVRKPAQLNCPTLALQLHRRLSVQSASINCGLHWMVLCTWRYSTARCFHDATKCSAICKYYKLLQCLCTRDIAAGRGSSFVSLRRPFDLESDVEWIKVSLHPLSVWYLGCQPANAC